MNGNRKSFKLVQVINVTQTSSEVSNVTVDDEVVVHESGENFPITDSNFGVFKTVKSINGLKTVKITVTGGTNINITDSNLNTFTIPVTGPGAYIQENVYFAEPNENTNGVGITLE